jgi:alkylhydroperoxidase family enzyme
MTPAPDAPRISPITPGTDPGLAPLEQAIQGARGRISLLYQVLLNAPDLAAGWEALLTALRNKSSVPPPLREMIILRIAVLNGAPYEFEAHIPHARAAGLAEDQIEALKRDDPGDAYPALARQVLAATDAMSRDIHVADEIFAPLQASFDARGLTELVATIAAYNMVSRFLVALRIGHEPSPSP